MSSTDIALSNGAGGDLDVKRVPDGRYWGVLCRMELEEIIGSGTFRDGTRANTKAAKSILAAIEAKTPTRAEKYIEDVYGKKALRLVPNYQVRRDGTPLFKD